MRDSLPPRWMERLLISVLRRRDRETIAGDLLEEYREERLPLQGRRRANLWYARHALSIATISIFRAMQKMMKNAAAVLCVFCLASAVWLGVMENLLRHPGYPGRTAIAAVIAIQCIAGMIALASKHPGRWRWLLVAACIAVFAIGVSALGNALNAAHFEGYAVIIGFACVFESTLTALSVTISTNVRTS